MTEPISIASPDLTEEEISAVIGVLRSGSLAQGPMVASLESAVAKYLGVSGAAAVSSGTAAIHALLIALGVGPGDEVIVPAFTFVGTVNPVIMVGARPVFVDIDDCFLMSIDDVGNAFTSRTRAVIPVHLYGQMVDVGRIRSLVDPNCSILEDACQSIGASNGAGRAGSLGDGAAFSLYATKNLVAGEGGLAVTPSVEVDGHLRSLRQHGMVGPYEYAELGYNYRMTDIQAAIALVQLDRLQSLTEKRRRNAGVLSELLSDVPGLRLPTVAVGNDHVWHQYTVRLEGASADRRDRVVSRLRADGIGAGVYYPRPLSDYEHIALAGDVRSSLVKTRQACSEVFSLPVHTCLSEDDLVRVAEGVRVAVHSF